MKNSKELLWNNISQLPFFRGFLRAVEGNFYSAVVFREPILDLGCGDGHFAVNSFEKKIIIGIEPYYHILQAAKEYGFYHLLNNCCGDRLPFANGFFKTVISNSVLEHILDVDAVFHEVSRVLKQGGQFAITVPNDLFTKNLYLAKLLDKMSLSFAAEWYRKIFNFISRHHHTDSQELWETRFTEHGFRILESWNYFPPESLKILEIGHYLGLPAWINKQLFGRWVIFQSKKNIYLRFIYNQLVDVYNLDQRSDNGAYTFFIAQKT